MLCLLDINLKILENLNRSEEHTSELQSQSNLVCRLLLEKKKKHIYRFLMLPSLSTSIYCTTSNHFRIRTDMDLHIACITYQVTCVRTSVPQSPARVDPC